MNQDAMVRRLVTEFSYPEAGARLIAEKLASSQPQIQTAIETWWDEGEAPTFEVAGYSFERLTREHNMNPFAAFLTLDWLLREPEKAVTSLQKGHDFVA